MAVKKRDTSKKRMSILNAAERAFIEEGYELASMDRIAEAAGASKRTVYNHFSSKEELFWAVLGRMMAETKALKQIPYNPKASLASQLGKFADAKIAFVHNPTWVGMMKVTAGVFYSHPHLAQEAASHAEDTDALAEWLQAANDDERMKVKDVKLASAVFWSMVGGAFFWPGIFLKPLTPKEIAPLKKEIVEMFLHRYQA